MLRPRCSVCVCVCIQPDTHFPAHIAFLTSHFQVGVVLAVVRCTVATTYVFLFIRHQKCLQVC